MDKLLTAVLDAHGGLENWAKVTKITARISLAGPFWEARGWTDAFVAQTLTLDPHHQHITFEPFNGEDLITELSVAPERVTIKTQSGQTIEERVNPRDSFPFPFLDQETPWDAIQVAYFTSAAVWNYFTGPFVFTHFGVEAHEVDPWSEYGQTWRRLAVTFPNTIAGHNAKQVFYYDKAFMLQRMDYSPDVTGSPLVAHYTYDHKSFDGFIFPTHRLVFLHDANGVTDKGFAPITIDISDVVIHRAPTTSHDIDARQLVGKEQP